VALVGRGRHVALWLNPNAKQVRPSVVEAFRRGLPEATLITARTMDEARERAKKLARTPPPLLLCGGGDGTAVTLVNLLRSEGVRQFPLMGFLRLGTGNGWPNATGAPSWRRSLAMLPSMPLPPPTRRFNLIEVEGRLCHFCGVGWDAMVLHDYHRTIRRRERQQVAPGLASRLSKSVLGYLYAVARRTVPRELGRTLSQGRPRATVTNAGPPAYQLDRRGRLVLAGHGKQLFDGHVSILCAGTEPFWGGGFKAFPFSGAVPGTFSLRVYDRPVLEGVANSVNLWAGRRVRGMSDFFVSKVRVVFSRPMPFQVGGDVVGHRTTLELALAEETLEAVDWPTLVG